MNLYAAIASYAIAAAFGAGTAWHWQDNRITQLELDHANERIASQRAARVVAERQIAQVGAAHAHAADRAGQLAVVVRDSRTELERLRNTSDDALRQASASLETCTAHAATQGELLDHCAGRLVDVSAAADGHVSDIKTLMESWPP